MSTTSKTQASQGDNSPQQAAVDHGVHAAFAAEGFLKDDGSQDNTLVFGRVFEILRDRVVAGKAEKDAKSVTRGEMVTAVFPALPGPETFTDAEDPQLAQAVWGKINSKLWSAVATGATGPVQKLVGPAMGNGFVLVRTKARKDRVDASYITDNLALIELEYVKPDNAALARKIESVLANRQMLMERQPHNAARYAKRFEQNLKAVSVSARDRLAITVATATGSDEPGETE